MGKLRKASIFCALAGFLCLGVIFITGASYPHIVFRIFQPLALLFIFLSLPLFALSWIMSLYHELKTRNYSVAAVSIISAVVGIIFTLFRLF